MQRLNRRSFLLNLSCLLRSIPQMIYGTVNSIRRIYNHLTDSHSMQLNLCSMSRIILPSISLRSHAVGPLSNQVRLPFGNRGALRCLDMNRPSNHVKHVDTSMASTCSENTAPLSRPMSYREIKRVSGFSPIVISVPHPV